MTAYAIISHHITAQNNNLSDCIKSNQIASHHIIIKYITTYHIIFYCITAH